MTFYKRWGRAIELKESYDEYIISFLKREKESCEPFLEGTSERIEDAIHVLMKIDLEEFVFAIDRIDLSYDLRAADFPQFSKFEDGIIRVPELISFYQDGLKFREIGYQLRKPKTELAQIKYGENHAKLAAMFSLVSISSSMVRNTTLGNYLVGASYDEMKPLLQRLLIRENVIKKLLCGARNGIVNYEEIATCMAPSTAIRRKSNLKILADFLLERSELEKYKRNINW